MPEFNPRKYSKQEIEQSREERINRLRRQNYFSMGTFVFTGILTAYIGYSQSDIVYFIGYVFIVIGLFFFLVFFLINFEENRKKKEGDF